VRWIPSIEQQAGGNFRTVVIFERMPPPTSTKRMAHPSLEAATGWNPELSLSSAAENAIVRA
jgi:hypothetical protein